jgi:hypothetical protein
VSREGIEPTRLLKLDFERSARTFSLQIQAVTSVDSDFTRSSQICTHSLAKQKLMSEFFEKYHARSVAIPRRTVLIDSEQSGTWSDSTQKHTPRSATYRCSPAAAPGDTPLQSDCQLEIRRLEDLDFDDAYGFARGLDILGYTRVTFCRILRAVGR